MLGNNILQAKVTVGHALSARRCNSTVCLYRLNSDSVMEAKNSTPGGTREGYGSPSDFRRDLARYRLYAEPRSTSCQKTMYPFRIVVGSHDFAQSVDPMGLSVDCSGNVDRGESPPSCPAESLGRY